MSVYDAVCLLFVYFPLNLLFNRCVNLLPPPDDPFLRTTLIFTETLSLAIHQGDPELIRGDFKAHSNP